MGELRNKDIFISIYPPDAKTLKIIFDDATDINNLVQKVLPGLFGNKFKVSYSLLERWNVEKKGRVRHLPDSRL